MSELDDLQRSLDTLKTEGPKNVELLQQIAAKAQSQIGGWKPLRLYAWGTNKDGRPRTQGEYEKAKAARAVKAGKPRVDSNGTKLTSAVVKRRAEKRKMFREAGMVKENGQWVKVVKGFK